MTPPVARAPLRRFDAARWRAIHPPMRATAILKAPWREPLDVLAAAADHPYAMAFLSGGDGDRARWSYVLDEPETALPVMPDDPRDPFAAMRALLGQSTAGAPDGPPFQGGVAGLLGYELGGRLEPVGRRALPGWPDLACGLYLDLLAFDHVRGEVLAIGRAEDEPGAMARARRALSRLERALPRPLSRQAALADAFDVLTPGETYEASVAAVVARIAAGEIFQANIARAWGGRLVPGVRPFDLVERLWSASPAPFAAYLRLPGRAVVSNSPERFVSVDGAPLLMAETRPIKGTRPRGSDPAEDRALQSELLACEKDRAENLMIVDLMRNDLSRVCRPGGVKVTELFKVETFANVHHLVSTVVGGLCEGKGGLDLLESAFPPGSITGAPKVQAIKVIADYEPPRGPYCGSMFWAGFDGRCDSSVLIRTAALVEDAQGWRWEARAGAGIVADSDPHQERLETEAKIDALRSALVGPDR